MSCFCETFKILRTPFHNHELNFSFNFYQRLNEKSYHRGGLSQWVRCTVIPNNKWKIQFY